MSNGEIGILRLELADLANGAPLPVAVASTLQAGPCNPIEPAVGVEARGDLVGEGFVVDKSVVAGGANGLLVKSHRVRIAPFDARNPPSDQECPVLEVLWAVPGPHLELPVVHTERFEVLAALISGGRLAKRGTRQGAIEFVLCQFEHARRLTQQRLRST